MNVFYDRKSPDRRFTILELLIVIVIILILVALLLPVLSKAKNRANLTVCANNQRQIAMGAILYAKDNDSYWSYRGGTYKPLGQGNPRAYNLMQGRAENPFDDRPRLVPYIAINDLHCPFVPFLDFENHSPPPGQGNALYSYSLYFGFKLTNDSGKRMNRVGDTMTLDAGGEFDIIVADYDSTRIGKNTYGVGHSANGTELKVTSGNTLWARQFGQNGRGSVDLNYTRSDGSLLVIRDVESADDRLTKIPYEYANNNLNTDWSQLPTVDYND